MEIFRNFDGQFGPAPKAATRKAILDAYTGVEKGKTGTNHLDKKLFCVTGKNKKQKPKMKRALEIEVFDFKSPLAHRIDRIIVRIHPSQGIRIEGSLGGQMNGERFDWSWQSSPYEFWEMIQKIEESLPSHIDHEPVVKNALKGVKPDELLREVLA